MPERLTEDDIRIYLSELAGVIERHIKTHGGITASRCAKCMLYSGVIKSSKRELEEIKAKPKIHFDL